MDVFVRSCTCHDTLGPSFRQHSSSISEDHYFPGEGGGQGGGAGGGGQ